jgi:hypothetical protein
MLGNLLDLRSWGLCWPPKPFNPEDRPLFGQANSQCEQTISYQLKDYGGTKLINGTPCQLKDYGGTKVINGASYAVLRPNRPAKIKTMERAAPDSPTSVVAFCSSPLSPKTMGSPRTKLSESAVQKLCAAAFEQAISNQADSLCINAIDEMDTTQLNTLANAFCIKPRQAFSFTELDQDIDREDIVAALKLLLTTLVELRVPSGLASETGVLAAMKRQPSAHAYMQWGATSQNSSLPPHSPPRMSDLGKNPPPPSPPRTG